MTMNFKIIKNADLDNTYINKIAYLKIMHWNYPIESQIKWIEKNFNDSDLHFFLEDKDCIISYCSLKNIKVIVNDKTIDVLGLGSVCTNLHYLKKGYGTKLIKFVNEYIINNKKQGVLLCKNHNLNFYKKSNWNHYLGNVYINDRLFTDNLCYLNIDKDIYNFQIEELF